MNPRTRLLRALLIHPSAYRQIVLSSGATGAVALQVAAVYAVIGVRAFVADRAGDAADIPRFVAFGTLRWVLLALMVWWIGESFWGTATRIPQSLRGIGLAHLPLLLQAIIPHYAGVVLGFVWFVAAVAAASIAILALPARQGAMTGGLAFCGLLVVLAVTPVDLLGLPTV